MGRSLKPVRMPKKRGREVLLNQLDPFGGEVDATGALSPRHGANRKLTSENSKWLKKTTPL